MFNLIFNISKVYNMKKLITILLISTILPTSILWSAKRIHPSAGTTSATFLKLGLGSRAIGMGEAFAGLADDISALYWNPAGLIQLSTQEAHLTHNESFEGIRHDFIGYIHLLPDATLAAAIYGLSIPKDIERRSGLNENDPFEPFTSVEGYFGASDLAVHVSYSRVLRENLSGGASLKLIQQNIDNESAYGLAMDIGGLYHFKQMPLSVGAVLQHMGTKIKFGSKGYFPPTNLKIGGAWKWNPKLVTTLDLNKPIDNYLFVSIGGEYKPRDPLFIRLGYKYRWYGQELDDLSGLSAGLGFDFEFSDMDFRFDYAFSPFGVLGNSQRISITSFFGTRPQPKPKKPKKKKVKKAKNKKTSTKTKPLKPIITNSFKEKGYTLFDTEIKTSLKMVTGRVSLNSISISCMRSDAYYIEGIIRAEVAKKIAIKVAEKAGDTPNVYKYFDFDKNIPASINKVLFRLRIPKSWKDITIKTINGESLTYKTLNEDENFIHYQINLQTLAPFVIEGTNTSAEKPKGEEVENKDNLSVPPPQTNE